MPRGTVHSATSSTVPAGTPRARSRRSVRITAAMIPAMMHSA